jgi:methylated-DNA-[protein]-cysteine S-methyltransferase
MQRGATRGPTGFERSVYALVRRIPRGKVTTYGRVAAALGIRSARPVGQALRRNPFAPRVPCHRVVAADLSLGGFAGATAGAPLARKRRRLASEGVRFRDRGAIDPVALWTPPRP